MRRELIQNFARLEKTAGIFEHVDAFAAAFFKRPGENRAEQIRARVERDEIGEAHSLQSELVVVTPIENGVSDDARSIADGRDPDVAVLQTMFEVPIEHLARTYGEKPGGISGAKLVPENVEAPVENIDRANASALAMHILTADSIFRK